MKSSKLTGVFVYCCCFLQGGTIMGYELLIPKLNAPYFGSSLYAWSSSLILTMAGLASGYYLSGKLENSRSAFHIRNILVLAATLLLFVSVTSNMLNNALLHLPLKQGIVLSSLIHLFPVLLCLGMVSPLLIAVLGNSKAEHKGRSAGRIFSVSTIAGIIFSLLAGFYMIPELGLMATAGILTITLLMAALLMHFVHIGKG